MLFEQSPVRPVETQFYQIRLMPDHLVHAIIVGFWTPEIVQPYWRAMKPFAEVSRSQLGRVKALVDGRIAGTMVSSPQEILPEQNGFRRLGDIQPPKNIYCRVVRITMSYAAVAVWPSRLKWLFIRSTNVCRLCKISCALICRTETAARI